MPRATRNSIKPSSAASSSVGAGTRQTKRRKQDSTSERSDESVVDSDLNSTTPATSAVPTPKEPSRITRSAAPKFEKMDMGSVKRKRASTGVEIIDLTDEQLAIQLQEEEYQVVERPPPSKKVQIGRRGSARITNSTSYIDLTEVS
jgi:hypothetical protein